MKIIRILSTVLLIVYISSCTDRESQFKEKKLNEMKTIGSIEKFGASIDALLVPDAKLEILADGHDWIEGPVWVPALQSILYSDIPRNAIYRWKEGERASIWLKPAGYTGLNPRGGESGSNGLILNGEGQLILAQHGDRRIAKLEALWDAPEATFITLADNFEGKRFNSPNDVAIKSNGDIYFTDPTYGLEKGIEDPGKELKIQGVYRLAKDRSITLLTDKLSRPNGIAFAPDEKTLYVANSDRNQAVIMAYDVIDNGNLENGRVFFDSWGDGMAIDQKGNIYAAGPGGILVIAPNGKQLGTFKTTQATSNCTFGDDGSTLYITADMYLLRIRLKVKGIGF